jgi:hypothetical protein
MVIIILLIITPYLCPVIYVLDEDVLSSENKTAMHGLGDVFNACALKTILIPNPESSEKSPRSTMVICSRIVPARYGKKYKHELAR